MIELLIGFAVGCLVVYCPMKMTVRYLEKQIHRLIKDRNFATLEKYMKQLEGGND